MEIKLLKENVFEFQLIFHWKPAQVIQMNFLRVELCKGKGVARSGKGNLIGLSFAKPLEPKSRVFHFFGRVIFTNFTIQVKGFDFEVWKYFVLIFSGGN